MTFQILSLSGGGYFGLFTATVLADLEQRAGKPLRDCFDLIAGTSVGGILALGLAAGVPAEKIRKTFEARGGAIFPNSGAPRARIAQWAKVARSLFRPLYSDEPLRQAITEIVGEQTIIGDLGTRILVPAVNLTNGQPKVFKTPHHRTVQCDWKLKAVDVGLATSAAPTYFPIAEVGTELFADGGLFATAPDMLAVHEATQFLDREECDVSVLSVGTTTSSFSFSHVPGRALGVWHWAQDQRLVDVILSSQQKLTDFMMTHKLGARYIRIDAAQSREQVRDLGLDIATEAAQKTIKGLAASASRDAVKQDSIPAMLAHKVERPTFFHGPQAKEQ